MAVEWQTLSLADVYDFSSGLSKPRSEFGSGHPFLSFKDVFYNSAVPKQLTDLVQSSEQERARCSVRRGDVFLTRTSETMDELGMSSVALADIPDATFNGFTKRLRPKRKLIAPGFARYFFRSYVFRTAVNSMATMSTRASLNNEMLERLTITFPDYPEQEAIAHILGTLDDKIELNRRRNQTLEAMARALFKDWFVDFGPVRAKMEGRDAYLPADLWQLFPDRLDDEGKPEGWIQQRVGDTGSIICGKTPPTKNPEYYGEDVPFITIPEMHGNIFATDVKKRLSHKGAASQAKKMLPSGSICVSCIATLGLVIITTEPSQTNQQINSVIPAQENETYFWYWTLKNLGEEIKAGGSGGSVLGNLSTGRFSELQVNASTASLRFAYNARVKNLFAQILANERESRTLAQLRDTLLPKLISGELRIKDAEKFIEAAQ